MNAGGRLFAMGLLVLGAGCRASSGEGTQAANEATPVVAMAPVQPPVAQEPIHESEPQRPSAEVTVRAHPAPLNPLDLPPSEDAAQPTPFPDEVTRYMVDRDGCDHFRGEEAYDFDRRAYLQENITELCTGTDARLAMLRQLYAKDPAVTAALKGYEDRIEGSASQ